MKKEQLGLTEYNDIILSLYDANPIAQVKESFGGENATPESKQQPEQDKSSDAASSKDSPTESKRVRTGILAKETYKLKLAAVANLKLTKRIFAYEKQRFKKLKVQILKLEKPQKEKNRDTKEDSIEKEEKKGGGLLGRSLKRIFDWVKRKLSTKIKRALGPKRRKQLKRLRRRASVRAKRLRRAITKPIRQTRRFLTKQLGNVKRLFTKGIKSSKGLLKKGVQSGKSLIGKGIQSGRSLIGKGVDAGKGLLGKGIESAKGIFGKAKNVGGKALKGIAESPIAKRLAIATSKFGGRMIPVAGTAVSAADAADRASRGDTFGAWLAGIGGTTGLAATATAPAAVGGVTAAIPAAAEASSIVADVALLGYDIFRAFAPEPMAEGGKVNSPQLALIGEGGESEFVVPKSKLAYFLGSDSAITLLNLGASELYNSAIESLRQSGLEAQGLQAIPELSNIKSLPPPVGKPKVAGRPIRELHIGEKIKNTIFDGLKGLIEKIKSLTPGGILDGVKNLAKSLLTPDAAAATLDPSQYLGEVDIEGSAPIFPFPGGAKVSSQVGMRNGRMHYGTDIVETRMGGKYRGDPRTPILAMDDGVVLTKRYNSEKDAYEAGCMIRHPNMGVDAMYLHMNPTVKPGQKVKRGQVVGTLVPIARGRDPDGNTHLHLEMYDIKTGSLKNAKQSSDIFARTSRVPFSKIQELQKPKPTPKPPINKEKEVPPTPEPEVPDFAQTIMSGIRTVRQFIPVPFPVNTQTTESSGNYQQWGLNITGN
jgi:murein DD-endopeptidase MepM/ murein hydrolase activator NlpD